MRLRLGSGRGEGPAISLPAMKATIGSAAAAALLLAAGAFALSEYALRRTYVPLPEHVRASGPETRAEGRRLAKLYGCTSCHGADFRGLEYNDDPALVRNYAPNLTLIAARQSDAALAQAIRQGIRASDGRALWDMPSATFRTVSDAELGAVLAYLRSFPPGGAPTPRDAPGWRARLAILRGLMLEDDLRSASAARKSVQQPEPELVALAARFEPADAGPSLAQGRHIAMTVCSECHGSDLGGDAVEGGPDLAIAGAYGPEDFRRLMRTGVPPGGRDLGIMAETAREDLKVFTDREIDALHAYLAARAAMP